MHPTPSKEFIHEYVGMEGTAGDDLLHWNKQAREVDSEFQEPGLGFQTDPW